MKTKKVQALLPATAPALEIGDRVTNDDDEEVGTIVALKLTDTDEVWVTIEMDKPIEFVLSEFTIDCGND